jgi:hypothetical protein
MGKLKIIEIKFAFLSLLINFVNRMAKTCQVCIFIKFLLILERREELCVILHKPVPVTQYCDVRGLISINSL